MRRREFIAGIGGAAAAWPLRAGAQQAGRVRRVGVLVGGDVNDVEMRGRIDGFRQGLDRLGWSEGRNLNLDVRFASASSATELPALAKELVALQPDAIMAQAPINAVVLQRETRTIPIVFVGVPDPVGLGIVQSLARPGGNLTGLLSYEEGIAGKWLAMLKEIAPRMTRAVLVGNPKTTAFDYYVRSASIGSSLGIEVVTSQVETTADIERVIESFARTPNSGLVLPPDSTTIARRDLVVDLTARHRLPAVYSARFWVASGGLMSYGIDFIDVYRRAAGYVDRILRGANAADLPVQAPTKYETTVNLKAAKALGLEIPSSLLVRADEVIE